VALINYQAWNGNHSLPSAITVVIRPDRVRSTADPPDEVEPEWKILMDLDGKGRRARR